MRVIIAGSASPFTEREEMHWLRALEKKLLKTQNKVDSFMLPSVNNPLLIPDQMMAYRLIDIENYCDILITIGYPAFVLKHSHKRVLLFSLASSFHDWFDTEYGVLSTPQYQRIRSTVFDAEKRCLAEAEKITCASSTLAAFIRTEYKLKCDGMVLDDDEDHKENSSSLGPGEWIACESTLEPYDRVDLLLNAVCLSIGQWKLAIFVPSSSSVYRTALQRRIERLALKERVLIVDGEISSESLKKVYALVSIPFASTRIPESLLRARSLNVPVVTTTDSAAVLEVIRDEIDGFIVEPSGKEIASVADRIMKNDDIHRRSSVGDQSSAMQAIDPNSLLNHLLD
jgi:glycosyltransferase involved in cell wall biosynthesis